MNINDIWQAMANGSSVDLSDEPTELIDSWRTIDESLLPLMLSSGTNGLENDVQRYLNNEFRDAVKHLVQTDAKGLPECILKALCLLRLDRLGQNIGPRPALDFLQRDVLKELKVADEANHIKAIRRWLEMYCLGREMPDDFWGEDSRSRLKRR